MSAPVADFTFTPSVGFSPIAVQFADSSTGSPESWHWEFDDGNGNVSSSYDQNPSHLFAGPPYLWRFIRLTVANGDGQSTKRQGPFPGGVYLRLPRT